MGRPHGMDRNAECGGSRPKALSMAQAFARGERDPVAEAEAALERAEAEPGAFISLCRERALVEVEAARARIAAGFARGLLDGVPVAWKDVVDVRGSVTTAGSRVFELRRPPAERDAPIVSRAAGAGLVPVGKTSLTEFAYSALGLNPEFGTPRNAEAATDAPRVPGGSSAGSAVAVATGIVPLAVGTDTAGSLRIPAAFNGIVAYRPSVGRHELEGVTPLARTFDRVGPMATSVADCVALDDAMRTGVPRPRAPATPSALRVVVDAATLEDARVEDAVRRNLERAAERLAAAGVLVERRPVAALAEAMGAIAHVGWLGAVEAYAEYEPLLRSEDAALMDPRVRRRLEGSASMRPEHVIYLQRERARLTRAIRDELEGALLLTPTVSRTAPLLEPLLADEELLTATNLECLRLTMPGSYLDLATVALPTGRDAAGQFTSLQVSTPTGEDERLLRAALTVSHALGIEPADEDEPE